MNPRLVAAILFLEVASAGLSALAAVPDFVTYSGRLTDGTAWGQSQMMALTFRIYDKAEGGTMLHEQVFENAAVEDGYFSVILTGVAEVFGAHDATWTTVCVGQGCLPADDLVPRQQVGSVPYAIKAKRVVLENGGRRVSLDAVLIGTTQGVLKNIGSFDGTGKTTGLIQMPNTATGIQSGQKACQMAFDSDTAHMCTTDELNRSFLVGHFPMTEEEAWVHSNAASTSQADGQYLYFWDCHYWTIGTKVFQYKASSFGTVATVSGYTTWQSCDTPLPVTCCDSPAQ